MGEGLDQTGRGRIERSSRRALTAAVVFLLVWNVFQGWRATLPMKAGHDAFISRQIGRTALNHYLLGPGTTRLANVTAIRRDGGLILHRSYGPAASWVVALGMAAGLPYDGAVRLPVLVSMNFFLIGVGLLARRLAGDRAGLAAMVVAGLTPVVLFRYSLLCVFENLGLGPFMLALGIGLDTRSRWRTVTVGAAGTLAVMFSWIFLGVLAPWLGWRTIRGRRFDLLAATLAVTTIPFIVYLGTLQAATGDALGDVRQFVHHIGERSSWSTLKQNDTTVLTPWSMACLNGVRLVRNVGRIPLAAALLSAAVLVRRRRFKALAWCLGLLVLALPLNFAPNLAFLHDFFVLLYVPSFALAAGMAVEPIAARLSARAAVGILAAVLAAFVIVDLTPAARILRSSSEDRRQDAIARELGRTIGPDDLIVADPSVCSFAPDRFSPVNDSREQPPLPFYAGRICQTVLVAQTPDDAVRLAESPELGAGREVFILNCGKTAWDLPSDFRDCRPESPIARYQLWRVSELQTATNRVGTVR
ncbi:ArnT family glycosyltransferase [Paludisphaera rhizosphaerae]|uniref:ArnT family glycosyltransferase n=1 Tax=Paludisphaera rhizosphaerae TaxID=2711216 RepID=UPI0013EA9A60|nr:hypothetical protein [Paludisphaera rhizosphaerae]